MLAHVIMDPIMSMISQQLSAAERARQQQHDAEMAHLVNIMGGTPLAAHPEEDSDEDDDENGEEDEEPAPIPQTHTVVATA